MNEQILKQDKISRLINDIKNSNITEEDAKKKIFELMGKKWRLLVLSIYLYNKTVSWLEFDYILLSKIKNN